MYYNGPAPVTHLRRLRRGRPAVDAVRCGIFSRTEPKPHTRTRTTRRPVNGSMLTEERWLLHASIFLFYGDHSTSPADRTRAHCSPHTCTPRRWQLGRGRQRRRGGGRPERWRLPGSRQLSRRPGLRRQGVRQRPALGHQLARCLPAGLHLPRLDHLREPRPASCAPTPAPAPAPAPAPFP